MDPFFILPFLFSASDVSNLLTVGASALAVEILNLDPSLDVKKVFFPVTLQCDFHAGVHSWSKSTCAGMLPSHSAMCFLCQCAFMIQVYMWRYSSQSLCNVISMLVSIYSLETCLITTCWSQMYSLLIAAGHDSRLLTTTTRSGVVLLNQEIPDLAEELFLLKGFDVTSPITSAISQFASSVFSLVKKKHFLLCASIKGLTNITCGLYDMRNSGWHHVFYKAHKALWFQAKLGVQLPQEFQSG